MAYFDLYEIRAKSLERARKAVESALEINLYEHESSYHGGIYYRLNDVGQEHFILQKNFDPFEDDWFEIDFKDAQILLYVNMTERSKEIQQLLNSACLSIVSLRSEQL